MYVLKRDGRREPVHFDKITARMSRLPDGLNPDFCDPVSFLWRGRVGAWGGAQLLSDWDGVEGWAGSWGAGKLSRRRAAPDVLF